LKNRDIVVTEFLSNHTFFWKKNGWSHFNLCDARRENKKRWLWAHHVPNLVTGLLCFGCYYLVFRFTNKA